MNKDWLWDRKITLQKAKSILRDPLHPRFAELSALLLIRKNSPREVFAQYLSPAIFCQNWGAIKKTMGKDAWGKPRLLFWQAVYEKVRERLAKKGGIVRPVPFPKIDAFCKTIGQKIKTLRKKRGFTQRELAKKLRVSQQVISRIESGRQNISLLTLKNISSVLRAKVDFILQ